MRRKRAYVVNYGGLSVGEHDFEFELGEDYFSQFQEGELKNGSCKANVLLEKHSSFLKLSISIKGEAIVLCDRCLEELSVPVDFNSVLIIKFSTEIENPEFEINTEKEDIIYVNTNDTDIDLSQYFFDSINLSIPLSRIHQEDENGQNGCNEEMLTMFTQSK